MSKIETKLHWLNELTDEQLVTYAKEASKLIEELEDKLWITKHLRDDALVVLTKRGNKE